METHTEVRKTVAGFETSRRSVLKGGLAGAAALGLGRAGLFAQPPPVFDPEFFLLERTTFGLNVEMLNEVRTRGYTGFLDWQIAWQAIDDSAMNTYLAGIEYPYPPWLDPLSGTPNPSKLSNLIGKTPAQIYFQFPGETPGITASSLTAQLVALQCIHSRRQLQHVMADFWTNVHNRFLAQLDQHALWMPFQENVILPHALGNYKDMLRASAKHASMLLYLDQYKSDKTNPIENYARELLELHTVGIVNGVPNFSEADVVAVAKILTGWSFHSIGDIAQGYPAPDNYGCPNEDMYFASYGKFNYRKAKHKFGVKNVLGQSFGSIFIPAGQPCAGLDEGEDLLDFLALRDETAEHLARRMVEWFITDDFTTPETQSLIQRVANAYSTSGADIAATVRELFAPNHFDEIRPGPYEKVRRPLNFVCAVMRMTEPDLVTTPCVPANPPTCSGTDVVVPGAWPLLLFKMGQVPGWRPSPDGYPPENSAWTSSLHPRLEFASAVPHSGGGAGLTVSIADLDRIFGTTPDGQLAAQANTAIFAGQLPNSEVRDVQLYLDAQTGLTTSEEKRRECLAMIFSTPSYQYLY